MDSQSGSSGGDGEDGGDWFPRPQSNKVQRNFSTMSASHLEDSDSLFLPQNHDPHYDSEQAARRRGLETSMERGNAYAARARRYQSMERYGEGSRGVNGRYAGDGLDFRRPIMSGSAGGARERERSRSVSQANPTVSREPTSAPTAPVIDLTDENEAESDDTVRREVTGQNEGNSVGEPSRTAGGQRLPRFGRDVIDAEEHFQIYNHRDQNNDYDHFRPRALEEDGEDEYGLNLDLPGANFLALPPRRSATGRVQYSTLRRPTRPPSPPQEIDDEEVEFIGANAAPGNQGHGHNPAPRRFAANNPLFGVHRARSRSLTPYPANLDAPGPVSIDLTDEPDEDDDVQIVETRRRAGVNMQGPDLNRPGQHARGEPVGGFGVGRLVNMLRDAGAVGGRLAQRVRDFDETNASARQPWQAMTNDDIHARRMQLEEDLAAHNRNRAENASRRAQMLHRRDRTPGPHHNRPFLARPDGGPGAYHPFIARPRPAGMPNLGNIGAMMDYDMAAFDMGFAAGGGNDNRPPTPKYSPPPEAAKGFTRNPGEDEVVVCPNCGDELAVGVEESKQEIWVVKGCGHAYCGDCAQNRTKTKSKKGKDRAVDRKLPPPFKNCVVDGCGKSASARSMIRVYFGS